MIKQYAISLVNWNSSAQIALCVQMIDQYVDQNCVIICVDNASNSNEFSTLRNITSTNHDVKIIQVEENTGFAGGHLKAVNYANQINAVSIWLLNPDIILDPNTFSALAHTHQQIPNAVLGSITLSGHPTEPISIEDRFINFHYKFFNHPYQEVLFSPRTYKLYGQLFDDNQPKQVSAVAGSSIWIPMTVIRKYGFMRTDFFLYTEEIEYCMRLAKQGVPILVVPTSHIYHEKQGTSVKNIKLSSIIRYYKLRNQLIRIILHGNFWDKAKALLKNVVLLFYYLLIKTDVNSTKFIWYAITDGIKSQTGKRFAPENYMESFKD